jgi:tetratricopeptide (TPR) repeat protein
MKHHFNTFALCLFLLLITSPVWSQSKDEARANETLTKAFQQADPARKNEMIQKAVDLYMKAGMQKEYMLRVGDAYLERNDLVNAYNWYNRCPLKVEKADAIRKVGEGYVNLAFEDTKNEAKHIKKALDIYTKSNAVKEGNKRVAVKYEERGMDSYGKALDYYILAGDTGSVQNIAEKYEAAGPDKLQKAAETYERMNNTYGYEKAGDIYWNLKEYETAFSSYNRGNVTDGIRKYADWLLSEGRIWDADLIYNKVIERYYNTGRNNMMRPLAESAMTRGSYTLAKNIYEKLGDVTLQNKAAAYESLSEFQTDDAKIKFGNSGMTVLVKAISGNMNTLNSLKDLSVIVDDLVKGKPVVSLVKNEAGLMVAKIEDLRAEQDYYSNSKDAIVDNVYNVSTLLLKITNPEVRDVVASRFFKHRAFGNILDKRTYKPLKGKDAIKLEDVYL